MSDKVLFNVLNRMIDNHNTDGLAEKIDVFFALGKLTREEYDALVGVLGGGVEAAE